MRCELYLMAEHAKEAIKTLPTVRGIEYFIEVALVEITVILVPANLMGIKAGIIAIIISVLIASVLSYYSAGIECRESLPMLFDNNKGGN